MKYSTVKTVKNETIYVSIKLNDECKNGHQDFSITGDIYQAGKPKIDKYHLSGGCIHEDIEKNFPEFIPFIKLHLCDYLGIPMHAGANGFYHLTNGFNRTPVESKNFKSEFCDYYRVSPAQFDELTKTKNEIQYCLALESLGVFEQWKAEADKAIKQLESLTGEKFVNTSARTQYHRPSEEAISEELNRQKSGYYTKEAEEKRNVEAFEAIKREIIEDCNKEIEKHQKERDVKICVLLAGGKKALDNCIFYNHSGELAFNWRNYDNLSADFLAPVIDKIKISMPDLIIKTK